MRRRKHKMATPKQAFVRGPKDVPVEIGLDPQGNITVKPDPFHVSKEQEQQVVWECKREISEKHEHGSGGSPCFTVDFNDKNGSPFKDWHFQNHGVPSGKVRGEVPDGPTPYKYTINMHGKKMDPTGVVDK
jgi:hypothetical protein